VRRLRFRRTTTRLAVTRRSPLGLGASWPSGSTALPLPGTRNGAWVKHKHRRSEGFLITVWAPAQPRRPESFYLARRLADGSLESAGSVSLGLAGEARRRLRAELEAVELPHRRGRQRVRPVEPAVVATVSFHGPARGAVRDGVLLSIGLR
jgi:ATP-dependent DNA ligase